LLALASEEFDSRTAAQRRIKEILKTTPVGTSLAGKDLELMQALLVRHPRSAEKIGSGVAEIRIHPGLHNRPGFWLHRTDGTSTDFSYMKCLGLKTSRTDILDAFRFHVVAQVLRVRYAELGRAEEFFCPVAQATYPASEAQVDHAPPNTFQVLVENFLQEEKLKLLDVQVSGAVDGSMDKWFTDQALAVRWCEFHQRYAKLRVVSAYANQSLLKVS
jgi:hypothetical protein